MEDVNDKNCYPICGYKFEEVLPINVCPNCRETSKAEDLITEDDDYVWTL